MKATTFSQLVTTVAVAATIATVPEQASAQTVNTIPGYSEYGHTWNIGVGPGYFGRSFLRSPYITANYEFDVARNFTLAPFVGFSTYRSNPQPWGGGMFRYRGTIAPIGVKATYYFDDVLELPADWDLYAAASLGAVYINKKWDEGYTGRTGEIAGVDPVYVDLHIGAEYHINDATGIFVDLSGNVSSIGVALHR
jgi:hypothetical protein